MCRKITSLDQNVHQYKSTATQELPMYRYRLHLVGVASRLSIMNHDVLLDVTPVAVCV